MRIQKKRLPDIGIYTEDGHLFHHSSPQPLSLREIERLHEHGIRFEKRTRFTSAEDKQIRKNWRRFVTKHGMDYKMAPSYAGIPGHKLIFSSKEERVAFNKRTAFWPSMCRGLPHRCAYQVRKRIGVVFDTAVINGQAEVPYSKILEWTPSNTRKLLGYYKELGMSSSAIVDIGKRLGCPAHSCMNHLRSVLARRGPIPLHLRKKLWTLIMKYSVNRDGLFELTVRKAICRLQHEVLKDYELCTQWQLVAQRMVYPVERIKEAWFQLLADLQTQFNEQQQRYSSCKEAWLAALKALLNSVPPISCEDYSTFLRMLSERTPDDMGLHVLSQKLYDCAALEAKLEENGIVGFYCGGHNELGYLFKKTTTILWRLHRLLFRRLKLPYTLKERTQVLSLAYDYQCDYLTENDLEYGILKKPPNDDKEFLPNPFKDLSPTYRGFPALHRQPFVEALVVYSTNHFSDWIPPTVLRKYVVNKSVLALFPEKPDNSEIISQKDLVTAVSLLDMDVASETSVSDFESDESMKRCTNKSH